eukprot:GHVT01050285.1.p1 GENE.GHVT01050285.1~~GHVT01050285.1.p1  ORF type:complete len:180 (-),score=20.30 GHVT01050285.1:1127-1666(-)
MELNELPCAAMRRLALQFHEGRVTSRTDITLDVWVLVKNHIHSLVNSLVKLHAGDDKYSKNLHHIAARFCEAMATAFDGSLPFDCFCACLYKLEANTHGWATADAGPAVSGNEARSSQDLALLGAREATDLAPNNDLETTLQPGGARVKTETKWNSVHQASTGHHHHFGSDSDSTSSCR